MNNEADYTELEAHPRFALDDLSLMIRHSEADKNGNIFNASQPMFTIKDDTWHVTVGLESKAAWRWSPNA